MFSESSPSFSIVTSIRADGSLLYSRENTPLSASGQDDSQLYMLRYHRDRILEAAKTFGWSSAIQVLDRPQGLLHFQNVIYEHLALHKPVNPDATRRPETVSGYGEESFTNPIENRASCMKLLKVRTLEQACEALNVLIS